MTISLCMIVKNEEAVLSRCLDSVRDLVDEIIIVDTGSTDTTKTVAARYTDKLYDFVWIDDFAAARNVAFAQATMDYQMWLDADDVLEAGEREKLRTLKDTLPEDIDMVTMIYHTHFDEAGNPLHSTTRARLLRREKQYRWMDPVHECIPMSGNIFYSDIIVTHKKPPSEGISTRNLTIYEVLERGGKPFTPRQLYYFARELKDHGQWAKSTYYFERFLETGRGWHEDNIGACYALAQCYRMLKGHQQILPVLLKSFHFGSPRAEICCEIGYDFKRKANFETALCWFSFAASLGEPKSLGFVLVDYWGYIPNVECCVCCCALGQYARAKAYNEAAALYKPESEAVKQNRLYLSRF